MKALGIRFIIFAILAAVIQMVQNCHGQISVTGRFGFNTYDSFSGGGFKVHNYTASAVTIGLTNAAGTFVSADPDISLTTMTPMAGTWQLGLTNGGNAAATVPAGGEIIIKWDPKFKVLSSGDLGAKTLTWSLKAKVDGDLVVKTLPPVTVTLFANPSAWSAVGSGSGLTGAGIPMYTGSASAGNSTSTTINWGTIDIGSAIPARGRVVVSGLQGSYHGKIYIDDVVVSTFAIQQSDVNAVGPDVVWETDEPGDYIGKRLILEVGTSILESFDITANDATEANPDNFTYEMSPASHPSDFEWRYDQDVFDPSGDHMLPTPTSELDSPMTNPDPAHDRPDPQPIPGPDPATDETTDSDGDGEEGLSVEDHYRATRAAIEDALGGNGDKPRFDFDDWQEGTKVPLDDGAKGAGQAMGGGIGALNGTLGALSDVPIPGLGIGGGGGYVMMIGGYSVTIPVVAGAGWLRVFVAMWVTYFTFVSAIAIVRGAFAGK